MGPVKSLDACCLNFTARIPCNREREKYQKMFSKEDLIRRYRDGSSYVSLEHHYQMDGGYNLWVHTVVELVENPITNDVEAFLFLFDIDSSKNMQLVVDRLLKNDYKLLGKLDVATQKFTFYGENSDFLNTISE